MGPLEICIYAWSTQGVQRPEGERPRIETDVRSGRKLLPNVVKGHCRGRLLDLGCGKVPFYALYREYVSEIICVDWSNSLHGNGHVDAECDLTKDLPFANASFDSIILSDVLEHIPTPERLWGEMARLLRPGGNLLLSVPFFYWLHEEPHDYYRYTKYALRRFAEATGFDILLIKELGGAPEIMVDILSKFISRVESDRSVDCGRAPGWLSKAGRLAYLERSYRRGLRNAFLLATS